MRVLLLSLNLLPNIGGLETHLNDLIESLVKKNWQVFALAYKPLSTKTNWKIFEKNSNLKILRIPWIRGFFERLVEYPVLEFIYLLPGLFIVTPFVILLFKPKVIHAQGLISAVSAVFWGKLFKIRVVISLHNYYNFPNKGLYRTFVKFFLKSCDFVLSLSKQSNLEIQALGISSSKIGVFTYWINLEKFNRVPFAKEKLNWQKRFIVLFVGRLVEEKGVAILLESVKLWNKKVLLIIIGTGPLSNKILEYSKKVKSIIFLKKVDQVNLPLYYSAADFVIVPSINEEGFGRVILESLACGTPVVATKKGATTEAMNETVGKLIDITPQTIKDTVDYFYLHPKNLLKFAKNARKFAERRYSEKNVEKIIQKYTA